MQHGYSHTVDTPCVVKPPVICMFEAVKASDFLKCLDFGSATQDCSSRQAENDLLGTGKILREEQWSLAALPSGSLLPQSILALVTCFASFVGSLLPTLPSPWRLEEQTRPVAFLNEMAEISSVRRVAVILQVLPARWIW